MGKVVGVKAFQGMEQLAPHEKGRASSPKDFLQIIVLATVFFGDAEDAPPAEGVAQGVEPAAAAPGVLEVIPLVIR